MKIWILGILILFSVCSFGQGIQPPASTEIRLDSENAGPNLVLDITPQIGISAQDADQAQFENFKYDFTGKTDLKWPYTSRALWIRLQFLNASSAKLNRLIYFSSALTGNLELYSAQSPSEALQKTGSDVPFDARVVPARLPAFSLVLMPGERVTYFIKRTSIHNLATRIYLTSPEQFLKDETDSKATLFFYIGGIICLIVYNLFIGIYAKDANYFLYAAFAGSVAAAALNTQGFFDAYIFPHLSFSISRYLMVFSSLAVLSCLAFVHRFLNFSLNVPRALWGCVVLAACSSITLVMGFFPGSQTQKIFGHLTDLEIFCLLIFLITCGVIVYRRGYKLAQFFLLSWASLVIGVIAWFGMTYSVLPNSPITSHALMFGNLGEMLILSLGLAYKISILDQEKRQALRQARDKERYHRLVKVLSHDVANSILIFSGYVQRLKRTLQDKPEIKTVEKLESGIQNMKGMLDLVRGEEAFRSFKISVLLRPVCISDVAREVISFYEEAILQKNLHLKLEIPEGIFVMADRTALTNQVLSNLLSNAVKFSHPHSEILISLSESAKGTVLKICDHGVGIQADEIERIFFSDEVSSRHGTLRERGSGLGTSLVKGYMDIFNGRIEVSSIPESISKDSGTTVSLFFPKISVK